MAGTTQQGAGEPSIGVRPPAALPSRSPGDAAAPFGVAAPKIELPKGGGAIRGIGEKFAANPVTGTGSMSVPIATSPGRSGFDPQLSFTYDSGAGNGPFGFGWSLSLPSITRKTDKGLPRYFDSVDSDVFILSDAEDLVPVLVQDANGKWVPEDLPPRTVDGTSYRIRRYRPRIEGLFARIERWTNTADTTDVLWRSISKDNITTWYGKTDNSRVADPADPAHIFTWLICQTHDDKGNVIVYDYKREDSTRIFEDSTGNALQKAHERNRSNASRSAQRYPKRIRYGNRSPYFPVLRDAAPWPEPVDARAPDASNAWLFEVVFDYGEHDTTAPTPTDPGAWPVRPDPFSSCRAGFEVRTFRICQRVLMFHHFPGEDGVGRDCLVRSTDFTYSDEVSPTDVRNPVYTFLKAVTQRGYRRNGASYVSRSLPPVEFQYTEPDVQEVIEEIDPTSLENLPIGLDGTTYRWTDLHGEGIAGILTEQAGEWFYKRNLSPVPEALPSGQQLVKAKFAPLETVARKPNATLRAGAEFMDLAGDGQPDVVVMEDTTPGLYEHDDAEGWQSFRPFTSRLSRNFRDSNLKFVDLDGDGQADVLISEDDAFVWHASLAEEGFGPARRVAQALDEEKGPRVIFADATQSIYLSDLSGDGLTDIVRIRNGEVCYWPNLGYGRFGAKVTMDNAPWFDNPDQFDQQRIRLADIDGSGTTDIIYLHRDGVRLYFNQSGNSWSQPHMMKVFPRIDDVVGIVPTDLLGNGTACLVWSSPLLGDARRPMRYVSLMGGRKPHLLESTVNNLGAETRVTYAPSTRFYLQDKQAGRPWVTRLPFPVHVVERVETYDHVNHNRFATRYEYHHGYFDGEEREFRGFGMVEQWDTEQFAALAAGNIPATNIAADSHVRPVRTKTWFHTGVYLGRDHVSDFFAGLLTATDRGEYFREPGLDDAEARALLLPDTALPAGLTLEEEHESCRALKGSMLRQEVYADDADSPTATPEQIRRARTPYTVTEQNFTIRNLQPRGTNRHAVFFTHAREVITCRYERNPADPRVQHALTLEVDDFGNVLKQAAIGYGRRTQVRTVDQLGNVQVVSNAAYDALDGGDRLRQTTPLLTYTENRLTNAVTTDDVHRSPLPCEALTFELTGYTPTGPATGAANLVRRYQASDFIEPDPNVAGRLRHKFDAPEVPYEATAAGNRRRRLIESLRTLYRRDDLNGLLNGLLQLGELHSLALPGESYKLAFTPGLLAGNFQRPRAAQPDESLVPVPLLVLGGQAGDRGGYVPSQTLKAAGLFPAEDADDHWWVPSGRAYFSDNHTAPPADELARAQQHFFLPRRYCDPFGQNTVVDFDTSYDLLIVETRAALLNRVTVEANDYRVLQPRLISDPNRNRTEVVFDALGMVVGTAVMGKPLPAPVEGDSLAGFVADLTQVQLDGFFNAADPHATATALLSDATTRVIYDLDCFRRTQQANPSDPTKWQPACAATLARETHVNAPLPPQGLRIQLSFSYSDGFSREIQKKIQAEPGPGPQRDANRRIVVGPDGQPVPTLDAVSPRWVGSGWSVFNNKGEPVRQYEPIFTDTHRFEFDVRIGVSAVLFYDPAERVIATLRPNHTYEKVVFDPWQQTTYDVNDSCAPRNQQTGDPRTDPDVAGFMREYFRTLPGPWLTWYAERAGGAFGPQEQDAARKAAAHADTPTTAHFDVLGRPFLTVARNRVACTGHDLDGTEESLATRADLDIEGNQRTVRDERRLPVNGLPTGPLEQRIVVRYNYDMLGNRIHQLSMEAGARWVLNDVAGKPLRAWDSRGHDFSTRYDELRRPLDQYVIGTTAESDPRTLNPANPAGLLVDVIEYGESIANAATVNLRTRVYRHFDSAGLAINAQLDATNSPVRAYDFKGNLLRSTRRLASSYQDIPDWSQDREAQLETERFESRTLYDAFNRPVQSVAPHSDLPRAERNIIQPVFNEANLLERVDVWLARDTEPAGLLDPNNIARSPVGVANIDYDAKGQRLRIDCRNGATTFYDHDPLTFRLRRLYTKRGAAFMGDCDNPAPPPDTIAAPDRPPQGKYCGLQNLHYIYDPAGNITHIQDNAQQALYFKNQRVEPSNDYTYDALYRLVEATGREHLGQQASRDRSPPTSPDGFNTFHTRLEHPGNGDAMGTYVERYVYDAVGSLLQMQHRGSDSAHAGWTRLYEYAEASLVEPAKQSNRLSRTTLNPGGNAPQPETYLHDALGNMTRMPHLGAGQPGPNMRWDYRNQLRSVDRGNGSEAFYVYDASGQRVRKVWEKSPGLTEERIYLGGFEIFRRHGGRIGANTATLERETLHVMDDKQRIAVVETRTLPTTPDPHDPLRLIRYQLANHLGSASLELDEDAQITSYEEYAPYGSSTYQAMRSQTETANRYRYTGKERDEESALYYHGARYYAPWVGSWISTDPIGLRSGLNLYGYVGANPVNSIDPTGGAPKPALDKEQSDLLQKVFSGKTSFARVELGNNSHLLVFHPADVQVAHRKANETFTALGLRQDVPRQIDVTISGAFLEQMTMMSDLLRTAAKNNEGLRPSDPAKDRFAGTVIENGQASPQGRPSPLGYSVSIARGRTPSDKANPKASSSSTSATSTRTTGGTPALAAETLVAEFGQGDPNPDATLGISGLVPIIIGGLAYGEENKYRTNAPVGGAKSGPPGPRHLAYLTQRSSGGYGALASERQGLTLLGRDKESGAFLVYVQEDLVGSQEFALDDVRDLLGGLGADDVVALDSGGASSLIVDDKVIVGPDKWRQNAQTTGTHFSVQR